MSVKRRGDKREVRTLLGRLEYRRTYYKKASGGYEYPVDRLAGVEAYERISDGVGLALVETSCKVSYEKANEYITGSQISNQTVMNKIRAASPRQKPTECRAVAELHIDAEDFEGLCPCCLRAAPQQGLQPVSQKEKNRTEENSLRALF